MGKPKSPLSPLRAHHRLMEALISLAKDGKKLDPRPEEMDLIARVFTKAGGSWEGVFTGSIDEMTLLRKCIKVGIKKGVFTEKANWGT